MTDIRIVIASAVVIGLIMLFAVRPVLIRLPEPEEPAVKVAYHDLATTRFALSCSLLAMVAEAIALTTLPLIVQPLWAVLGTVGVFLAAIDGRTTWLPRRVTYLGWALMTLAVGLSAILAGGVDLILRTLAGAAIAGGLYLAIWFLTKGGFGFGDVRFAPLLGAAAASYSWTLLIWALTLGTAVGAGHGGSRLLAKKRGGFPYAPAMLAGTYLAALAVHQLRS
jgi:leader peptidase (prepilin peptidase)/N-methyltransferase